MSTFKLLDMLRNFEKIRIDLVHLKKKKET